MKQQGAFRDQFDCQKTAFYFLFLKIENNVLLEINL